LGAKDVGPWESLLGGERQCSKKGEIGEKRVSQLAVQGLGEPFPVPIATKREQKPNRTEKKKRAWKKPR